MTRHPHDTPWQPPRPREYPRRPAGRPYPLRRWPITPAAGKAHPSTEEGEE